MYTMRPAEFAYHRPTSLDEAISLLGEDARPIAGGHSLLPLMKLRLATPAALVDIGHVPGLDGISQENGGVVIGALATHAQVAGSKVMIGISPVIPETAGQIGDVQVRNRGTIGGSVAHADPSADYPTVLKALGATITRPGRAASGRSPRTTSSAGSSPRRSSRTSSSPRSTCRRRPSERARRTSSTAIPRRSTRSSGSRRSCRSKEASAPRRGSRSAA